MYRYIASLHSIEAYLEKPTPGMVLYIQKKSNRTLALEGKARSKRVPVKWVGKDAPCTETRVEKDWEALLKVPPETFKGSLEELAEGAGENSCVLALDGVTDVQNLGAILRSADLFEVDGVVIPKRRAAKETASVDRSSAGGSAYVPLVQVPNLARALSYLKSAGYWIYGADLMGEPLHLVDFTSKIVLVLGSEDKGMGRLVKETCDYLVRIPMGGHVGSFNVSVATGILLYEIRRRQEFRGLKA